MSESNKKMQSELFEEFEHIHKQKKSLEESDHGIFQRSFLRNTKIELPLDTLLVLLILLIILLATFFFLGIQKGKSLTKKTVITVEKEVALPQYIEDKDSSTPTPIETEPVVQTIEKTSPALQTSSQKTMPSPEEPELKYTIQIGASKDKSAAEKDVTNMIAAGYDAFILKSVSSSGSVWYRICVGRFSKSSDAAPILKKVKSGGSRWQESFLTRI